MRRLPPETTATGIVLAGGGSRRFGDRDKLLEPLRGMPLLHHPILRLLEVCRDVVVVIAPQGEPPPLPVGAPVRLARDASEGEGPLAGLLAGLGETPTELALVAGGDMPELSTGVLVEMLMVAGKARAEAVALQDGDRFRPLPCVVGADRARDVAHALLHDGERRLRGLLDALRVAVVDESTWLAFDPGRRTLIDVDEPGDLEGP